MLIRFATNSYQSDSLPVSAQRALNFYAEAQPPNAKTQVAVFGTPGIVELVTCGVGPVRGFHIMGGVLYVVSGPFLYSVSSTWVATNIGGQISGNGVVSMDDNGTELVIVNGSNGYIYDTVAGFRLISDADYNAANSVTHFDGYFLSEAAGTNKVYRSESLDGASYIATSFASKESKSDDVQSVVNHKQIAYIFGEISTELWNNVGRANFPFQRIPGASLDRGIIAPLAFAEEDEALFIIGNDRIAYRLSGQNLSRISTHAIEQAWGEYGTVSDTFGMAHTIKGHKFVYFTFPSANKTWCFDISTRLWHERESFDINGNALGRWRGNCLTDAYDRRIVGDAYSGKIGYFDANTYTEFSQNVRGELIAPTMHEGRAPVFMDEFELDVETGVGLLTGQGEVPQYMMDYSDDGGRTFSIPQAWQSAGRLGKYEQRLRWLQLGRFYQRTIRISISDPVKRVIIAAAAKTDVGI